ncbi:hypothetical protein D477_012283 [Arthrobacter crystallopoietes BAB-32]|uniref:Uncharacterized protein n=1 Tax=Arthrobacter crystallopoietes BAB-32 TaxID=1246476 RepID=N1V1T2_9MICC|nr:hypothetical protein [Arthrobacter crystallopoietes]EMY33954.1 hypothetical protein D477_012283 [Arthrobacter crystallopoietes BAB-32]
MSLQPPEYWLDMHNLEVQLRMVEAERSRRRAEAGIRTAPHRLPWRQRFASLFARPAGLGGTSRRAAVVPSPCPE